MDLSREIKILTYNIGNCGYGEDYHYTGSRTAIRLKNMFPSTKDQVLNNIAGQLSLIESINPDIILLQEISKFSMVSHFVNPYKIHKSKLNNYKSTFVHNYNFLNIVNLGLATFADNISSAKKIKTPFKVKGIINNYFCGNKKSVLTRMKLENSDKDLVIINIHLTAFKKNYEVRMRQLDYILNIAEIEFTRGNYIVIGGDFNIKLDNKKAIDKKIKNRIKKMSFRFIFPEEGTLRSLKEKYARDSKTIKYDGFLCSSNIETLEVKSLNDFRFSDHSPVYLNFTLK